MQNWKNKFEAVTIFRLPNVVTCDDKCGGTFRYCMYEVVFHDCMSKGGNVSFSPFDVVCSLVRSGSGRVVIRYRALEPKLWYVSEFGNSDETFINLLAVFQSKFRFFNHLPNLPCAKSFSRY